MAEGLIEKLTRFFFTPRQFVFRFDEYDGSEPNTQIYDGQVVEYEFINAGTTVCVIGNALRLYPTIAGMVPDRVKLSVNYNESDVTIYSYKFEPLTIKRITDPAQIGGFALRNIQQQLVVDTTRIVTLIDPKDIKTFNRLIVISKVKAKAPKHSIEPHGKENKKESFR